MFKNIFVTLMFLVSSVWAVGLTLENVNTENGTLDIVMNNDDLVAGFQLDLTGITISGASGGSAGNAGFMISTSPTTILGFSLSGATIPPGEGTLVKPVLDGVVSTITYIRGHGNIIILDHGGGFSTVYSHLDNITVHENEYVQSINPMAKVAVPEKGNIAKLHFEVWGNQQKLNPEIWLVKN